MILIVLNQHEMLSFGNRNIPSLLHVAFINRQAVSQASLFLVHFLDTFKAAPRLAAAHQ